MKQDLIELTEEQKKIALERYAEPNMTTSELTKIVFNNPALDGRSIEGRSLKAFLAGMDIEVRTTKAPVPPLELTEAQKEVIRDLATRTESSIELAKLVFQDETIKNLSREWRAVYTYLKEVYPEGINTNEEPVVEKEYRAPGTLQILCGVVNDYVTTGEMNRKAYNWNALKVSELRQLKALMSYVRVYRFKYIASQYDKQVDRELFISTFIRWAHDKPDLTQIEVDQMIGAAAETVNIAQIDRSIQRIDKMQEEMMEAGGEIDDGGGKKRKFGMTDVELINGIRTKHDQAKGRLEKLMESLESSRADRLKQRDTRNNSILNLFDAWTNDPEWRAALLQIGKREKQEDKEEFERLRDMDDVIALISGQTEAEAVA